MATDPASPVDVLYQNNKGLLVSKPKRDLLYPIDTRGLKLGDAFAGAGNLDEAFAAYLRFVDTCEARLANGANARVVKYRDQALHCISDLTLRFLLVGNFEQGLKCADAALARHPKSVLHNISRAHALMLLDRVEEARAIYLRYLGKRLSYGRCCNDLIRDAHHKLFMSDHEHPLMDEIEERISGLWVEDEDGYEDETIDPVIEIIEPPVEIIEPTLEAAAKPMVKTVAQPAVVYPTDIRKGDKLTSQGKLKEARDCYRRVIAICTERIAKDCTDSGAQQDFGLAIGRIGHLAFEFLREKSIAFALETIIEAMSHQPDWLWLQMVHAHALMLSGRITEALNVHRRNCRRTMDNREPWGTTIPADFAALRNVGYNLPIMNEIERQFASTK